MCKEVVWVEFGFRTDPQKMKGIDCYLWGTPPIASMYGIWTYICCKNQPNESGYTIHGWYGPRIPKHRAPNHQLSIGIPTSGQNALKETAQDLPEEQMRVPGCPQAVKMLWIGVGMDS